MAAKINKGGGGASSSHLLLFGLLPSSQVIHPVRADADSFTGSRSESRLPSWIEEQQFSRNLPGLGH